MEVVDLPNNESLLRSDQDGQDQEEPHKAIWRELDVLEIKSRRCRW